MASFDDNPAARSALELYEGIEADHLRALEGTGVTFAARDDVREGARVLVERLRAMGARVRNGGASVAIGRLSPGCLACTGSCASRTFALSNNCHRDCFFCFNPNQEGFAYYCEHPFPWRDQLDDLAAGGESPACLALSGGEPLLYPDEACAFFSRARALFPATHLRMYTSGDLLDADLAARLRSCGLDEVRFSVKQDDPPHMLDTVLANMGSAKRAGLAVMVEMPPIPGTEEQMREVLRRIDAAGAQGINLLEFAYPMWNWEVFEALGLVLRNPPYRVAYDYEYAGSLAVDGSEELCLGLMLWAREQGLGLSMHYCSLENKHRAQIRTINEPHAGISACHAFDYGDFFLKAGVVFGADRAPVREALGALGCADFIEDDEADATSFHPRWLSAASRVRVRDGRPVRTCVSTNVVVEVEEGYALRELKVELAEDAAPVQLEDVTRAFDEAAGDTIISSK
ncbi:hypothetical protein B5F40_02465 [Gordonibacter sp. An230]|uniref:radical SAM protein n=1 Tax=Gordonibacter sp. An230 TaxID=1965592 RepID=UPI000B3A4511|nr:radical SAM protein [Gordonibacter sp. An230]OUO91721.1 hypothetical protein B5F40_02465 [Gordonibacter sp. An230]